MGKGTDEMNDNETKTREIQDSIRRTEAEMADTITTIQHRLSPQHLKDEAMSKIKETAAKGMEKFQGTVKSNPGPFIAAAAGLTFLLLRRKRKNRAAAEELKTQRAMPSTGPDPGEPGMRPPEMGIMVNVPATAGGLATERTGRMTTMAQERPLLLSAVGIAIGAVIGVLLPVSGKERELLAQTRESLINRAREAGRSTMQRVQEMASGGTTQARAQSGPEYK